MLPHITSNGFNYSDFHKMSWAIYGKCAILSRAVVPFQGFVRRMRVGTLGWMVIGAYMVLIAVLTGGESFPAFRSIVNSLEKINEIVRGFVGA